MSIELIVKRGDEAIEGTVTVRDDVTLIEVYDAASAALYPMTNDAALRVAVAFEFPPHLPLTAEQMASFDALNNALAVHYNAPVHAILGFRSHEEMEAHRHKQGTNRSVTVPVEDLPYLNWPLVVSGTINFIGVDAPAALDWPEGATHHLEDIDGCLDPFFARLDVNHYRDIASGGFVFTEDAEPCGWKVTARPGALDAPEQVWAHIEHGQWDFDSLADLIRETTEHDGTCPIEVGTIVWRGTKRFDDPAGFIPGADDIINDMANNAACSDAGEWADDYPNVTEEAQAELNDFLAAWARKHAPVEKFYCVQNIEAYTVTAEDLAQ